MDTLTDYAANVVPSFYADLHGQVAAAWSVDTSAHVQWGEPGIPAESGQCAVTALLVQELFGGSLMRAVVNGESHYWNSVDGETVDFTRAQFALPLTFEGEAERERSYVLGFPATAARYDLLRSRLSA